jgi:hypothetical protein
MSSEDREDFMCAVVTVIFGVCNSVRLIVKGSHESCVKVVNKTNVQSKILSSVTLTSDNIIPCHTLHLHGFDIVLCHVLLYI